MHPWIRKSALFTVMFLSCASFNIVTPFYSEVAESSGIEPWLIGLIYSVCPVSLFIVSISLPSYLEILGRTTTAASGLFLIGFSNAILFFMSSLSLSISVSFLSKIAQGAGTACCFITANSILTSDYPEEVSKNVAILGMMGGLGFSLGSIIGSVIYMYAGFKWTCISTGLVVWLYAIILPLLIGKSRPYIKTRDQISLSAILPRKTILLDMGMQIGFMFAIGFFIPITQLYLLELGVSTEYLGLCYGSQTISSSIFALIFAFVLDYFVKPRLMLLGCLIMFLAFFIIEPCPLVQEKSLIFTVTGLILIGVGGTFLFIPALPHMIEVTQREYGFGKDDRLNDVLSGITNISICSGEFFGSIAVSVLYQLLGFQVSTSVVSLFYLCYGTFYFFRSDFNKNFEKNEDDDL